MVFQGLDQDAPRRGVAAVPRLGDRTAPADFTLVAAAAVHRMCRRAVLGRRVPEAERAAMVLSRRPARRAGGQRLLARQPRRGRLVPARLPVDLAAGGAARADDQRARWSTRCSPARRHWRVALHFNKGLAGAPAEAIAAARDTATNPAAPDAFALAISAAEGPPAFAGVAGHEPDLATARARRQARAGGDGRAAQAGAAARLLRLGSELLRGRLAERVLGRELSRGCAR